MLGQGRVPEGQGLGPKGGVCIPQHAQQGGSQGSVHSRPQLPCATQDFKMMLATVRAAVICEALCQLLQQLPCNTLLLRTDRMFSVAVRYIQQTWLSQIELMLQVKSRGHSMKRKVPDTNRYSSKFLLFRINAG